jgi:ABC-2 type transport system permease protein
MHPILVLLRKDFRIFFSDKAAVALTFIVPFALIYLFGQIFGVGQTESGPSGIPLAVVNQSDNAAAASLVAALKAERSFRLITTTAGPNGATRPLLEEDLRPLMRANRFRFAVVLPADLVNPSQLGLHLKILSNPRNDIETQTVNGILQKTIFTHVPQLLGQSLQASASERIGVARMDAFNRNLATNLAGAFGGDADAIFLSLKQGSFGLDQAPLNKTGPATENSRGVDLLGRLVRIETEQVAGEDVKSPAATRIVGGWAMQFLLFALSASATALFYEKEQGLFQRLLSAPVTRAHLLWSKFLYGVCLGLVQLMVLFFAGRVLFGIDVENHLGLLVVICTFAAAACTAFGMLLAAVAPSAEAARGLATFLILLMSAIGGAWFPVSLMPEFIQQLSKFTLVYWSMEGFAQVLWNGDSFAELLPTLGILTLITGSVMALAVWRFNRGKLFE